MAKRKKSKQEKEKRELSIRAKVNTEGLELPVETIRIMKPLKTVGIKELKNNLSSYLEDSRRIAAR